MLNKNIYEYCHVIHTVQFCAVISYCKPITLLYCDTFKEFN